MDRKYITLKNLMIAGQKCIGLKFYQDKVLQALVNELPGIAWSEEFHMNYVPSSPAALDGIFEQFQKEAYFRENYYYNRDYLDSEIYSLLRSDYITDSKNKE